MPSTASPAVDSLRRGLRGDCLLVPRRCRTVVLFKFFYNLKQFISCETRTQTHKLKLANRNYAGISAIGHSRHSSKAASSHTLLWPSQSSSPQFISTLEPQVAHFLHKQCFQRHYAAAMINRLVWPVPRTASPPTTITQNPSITSDHINQPLPSSYTNSYATSTWIKSGPAPTHPLITTSLSPPAVIELHRISVWTMLYV